MRLSHRIRLYRPTESTTSEGEAVSEYPVPYATTYAHVDLLGSQAGFEYESRQGVRGRQRADFTMRYRSEVTLMDVIGHHGQAWAIINIRYSGLSSRRKWLIATCETGMVDYGQLPKPDPGP